MKQNNYSGNLIKNTFLLSINKFISPLIAFLLLPIYTHNISTEEYGIADVIQTYVALLVPILLIRVDIGMFRFLVERRGDKRAISEITTNTLAIALPLTILATIAMIAAIPLGILPFQFATVFYFLTVMANNLVSPLTRGLGKNSLFAAASIVDVLSKLFFGIVFVLLFKLGGFGLMLSLGLSTLLGNIICIAGIKSSISINRSLLNKSLRKELIKLSAPIVVDGVSFWVINTSDRTVLSVVLGAASNGIYAVANKFSNLISSMTTVFWMSWSEQASIAVKDDGYPSFVSKIFDSYLRVAASISICIMAAVPVLFHLIIGPDYSEAMIYIPFLILGLFLNAIATFYGPIYLAFKKSKEVAISTGVAAIINLAVDLALIWFVGIWAAVISTVAAYLFVLVYRFFDTRKMVKISYNARSFVIVVVAMATSTFLYYVNNPLIIAANIALVVLISIALNRELIAKLFRAVASKLKYSA